MSSEIDNIVAHFKYLSSAGYEASLTLCSEKGQTHVKLDVNLGFILPSFTTPPPDSTPSRRRRPPGYYCRLKKRSDARQQLDSINDKDDSTLSSHAHIVPSEEDDEQLMNMVAEEVSRDSCSDNAKVSIVSSTVSSTKEVNTEASCHSKEKDVAVVCERTTERSNDSKVCKADEVTQNKVVTNVEVDTNTNMDRPKALKITPFMQTDGSGQSMPNDAARKDMINGYPMPRLQLF